MALTHKMGPEKNWGSLHQFDNLEYDKTVFFYFT